MTKATATPEEKAPEKDPRDIDWSHRATFRKPELWDRYLNVEHPFAPLGLDPKYTAEVKPAAVVENTKMAAE